MKKIYLLSVCIALTVYSCDYVGDPIPPSNLNADDTSTCSTPIFPTITTHVRKVLIEDYTGHTCTNCPNAARKLNMIDTANQGKIIPLAVHVSNYAEPNAGTTGGPVGSYTVDYRTDVGNLYDAFFKIAAGGLPKGMINRIPYNSTTLTHRKNWWEWEAAVASIINQPAKADIQIINNFDVATKKLCTHVKTQFLTADTGTFKLVVLLVQDSIIDWQYDGGVNKSNYVHRHVLRDAINSAWGNTIATGNIATGFSYTTKFAYKVPADFKGVPTVANHMHIVAFVYDDLTFEIIQAEEEKMVQ